MPHVLVVHESESIRSELKQALMAEDFKVTEADSAAAAVRELWAGSFDAAVCSPGVPGAGGRPLEEDLRGPSSRGTRGSRPVGRPRARPSHLPRCRRPAPA